MGQGAPQRVRDRDNMQAAVSEELYLVRRGRGGEAKSGKEEDREIGGGCTPRGNREKWGGVFY